MFLSRKSYIIGSVIFGVVILFIISAIILAVVLGGGNSQSSSDNSSGASNNNLSTSSDVIWNKAMVLGDPNTAEHHFVEYSDIFCPYCFQFSSTIFTNYTDVKKNYLDNKKMSLELRLTYLLQSKPEDNSQRSAEYAFCAADQNQFWPFYEGLLSQINTDYFSKGIGAYHGAPDIEHLEDSYYDNVARDAGLNIDNLNSCISSNKGASMAKEATSAAIEAVGQNGLPYFDFGSYKGGGFSGDYKRTKELFKAGGVS